VAKLCANENFPFAVVEELRRAGHDVIPIQKTGKAGQRIPDDIVLQYAVADGRAVLTLNRKHFFRLHHQYPDHAGIVACTVDGDLVRQAGRIDEAVGAAGVDDALKPMATTSNGVVPGDRGKDLLVTIALLLEFKRFGRHELEAVCPSKVLVRVHTYR
jgi:hypothetical protein